MVALVFIVASFFAVAVDMPYKELAKGKHYDCEKVNNGVRLDELADAVEYCRMNMKPPYNSCGQYASRQRDWKTGECVNR